MTKQFNDWLEGKDKDKVMVACSKALLFISIKESLEGKMTGTKKQTIYEREVVVAYYNMKF